MPCETITSRVRVARGRSLPPGPVALIAITLLVALQSGDVSAQSLPKRLPKLGVALQPVKRGGRILDVLHQSAAEENHLKPGDIITSVNGWRVHNVPQLRWVVAHSFDEDSSAYVLNVRYLKLVDDEGDRIFIPRQKRIQIRQYGYGGGYEEGGDQEKPQEKEAPELPD